MASDERKKVSIRFNGQEVSDASQLPPEIRKMIEAAESKLAHPAPSDRPGEVTEEKVRVETTTYQIGSKTYRSLDEMPADLRKVVESAKLERGEAGERVEVSSKTYHSLDEMPPELRAAAESMLAPNDAGRHRPLLGNASLPQPRPTVSDPPEPRLHPAWSVILLSVLAGALLMYFLMRH